MSHQSILSTNMDLLEDSLLEACLLEASDEEEEFEKDVLIVWVLAEEYLQRRKGEHFM